MLFAQHVIDPAGEASMHRHCRHTNIQLASANGPQYNNYLPLAPRITREKLPGYCTRTQKGQGNNVVGRVVECRAAAAFKTLTTMKAILPGHTALRAAAWRPGGTTHHSEGEQ